MQVNGARQARVKLLLPYDTCHWSLFFAVTPQHTHIFSYATTQNIQKKPFICTIITQ